MSGLLIATKKWPTNPYWIRLRRGQNFSFRGVGDILKYEYEVFKLIPTYP